VGKKASVGGGDEGRRVAALPTAGFGHRQQHFDETTARSLRIFNDDFRQIIAWRNKRLPAFFGSCGCQDFWTNITRLFLHSPRQGFQIMSRSHLLLRRLVSSAVSPFRSSPNAKSRRPTLAVRRLNIEPLEDRTLLSVTYYVDGTNGNDSYTTAQAQSIATPWKTIQNAATNMVAGDVCNIRAGTYRETVTVPTSGSSGAPITFQAYNNETVTIDGTTPIYSPEAWWKFENNLNDSVGGANGSGSVGYVAGKVNQGIELSGSSYVQTSYGNGESSTTPRTYALWVNTDTLNADRMCLVQSWTQNSARVYVGQNYIDATHTTGGWA
jgi:hypothetical protein